MRSGLLSLIVLIFCQTGCKERRWDSEYGVLDQTEGIAPTGDLTFMCRTDAQSYEVVLVGVTGDGRISVAAGGEWVNPILFEQKSNNSTSAQSVQAIFESGALVLEKSGSNAYSGVLDSSGQEPLLVDCVAG